MSEVIIPPNSDTSDSSDIEMTSDVEERALRSDFGKLQFAWLYRQIGKYQTLRESTPKKGASNPAVNAFLNDVWNRFNKKWGWKGVDLPSVGLGGTDQERRVKAGEVRLCLIPDTKKDGGLIL